MSEAQNLAPKKSKKKLVVLLTALLLLAGGGAGAAWFVLNPGAKLAAGGADEPPPQEAKRQLYQTLDLFTVNLQDTRGERFAQVGITLQYENPDVETNIKDRLPSVRNDILLLLSSKQPEELLTAEGKQQLAQQIRTAVGKALGYEERRRRARPADEEEADEAPRPRRPAPHPIKAVLFSQFIVQ